MAIDGNPLKHYVTIFMVGDIADDSAALKNMEPHKCESWNWLSWVDVLTVLDDTPERLFEPMRNLIATLRRAAPDFLDGSR